MDLSSQKRKRKRNFDFNIILIYYDMYTLIYGYIQGISKCWVQFSCAERAE